MQDSRAHYRAIKGCVGSVQGWDLIPKCIPGSCSEYALADADWEIRYRNWLDPLVSDTVDTFINAFSPPTPSPIKGRYRPRRVVFYSALFSTPLYIFLFLHSLFYPVLSRVLLYFFSSSQLVAGVLSKMSPRQGGKIDFFQDRINYVWKIIEIKSSPGLLECRNSK